MSTTVSYTKPLATALLRVCLCHMVLLIARADMFASARFGDQCPSQSTEGKIGGPGVIGIYFQGTDLPPYPEMTISYVSTYVEFPPPTSGWIPFSQYPGPMSHTLAQPSVYVEFPGNAATVSFINNRSKVAQPPFPNHTVSSVPPLPDALKPKSELASFAGTSAPVPSTPARIAHRAHISEDQYVIPCPGEYVFESGHLLYMKTLVKYGQECPGHWVGKGVWAECTTHGSCNFRTYECNCDGGWVGIRCDGLSSCPIQKQYMIQGHRTRRLHDVYTVERCCAHCFEDDECVAAHYDYNTFLCDILNTTVGDPIPAPANRSVALLFFTDSPSTPAPPANRTEAPSITPVPNTSAPVSTTTPSSSSSSAGSHPTSSSTSRSSSSLGSAPPASSSSSSLSSTGSHSSSPTGSASSASSSSGNTTSGGVAPENWWQYLVVGIGATLLLLGGVIVVRRRTSGSYLESLQGQPKNPNVRNKRGSALADKDSPLFGGKTVNWSSDDLGDDTVPTVIGRESQQRKRGSWNPSSRVFHRSVISGDLPEQEPSGKGNSSRRLSRSAASIGSLVSLAEDSDEVESSGSSPFAGECYNGKYRVMRVLGRGSFGIVYLVSTDLNRRASVQQATRMGMLFAMKVVYCGSDDEMMAAFNEFKAMKQLQGHPNIVRLVDMFMGWETEAVHKAVEDRLQQQEEKNNRDRHEGNISDEEAGEEEDGPPSDSMSPISHQLRYVSLVMEYYSEGTLEKAIEYDGSLAEGTYSPAPTTNSPSAASYKKTPTRADRQPPVLLHVRCTSTDVVLSYFQQMLSALAHSHARNIVHRDLKPANVLLTDEGKRVVISDFGLAKDMTHSATHAGGGGTLHYLAPEQLEHRWSKKSDVWSLACIIVAMITHTVGRKVRPLFLLRSREHFEQQIRAELRARKPLNDVFADGDTDDEGSKNAHIMTPPPGESRTVSVALRPSTPVVEETAGHSTHPSPQEAAASSLLLRPNLPDRYTATSTIDGKEQRPRSQLEMNNISSEGTDPDRTQEGSGLPETGRASNDLLPEDVIDLLIEMLSTKASQRPSMDECNQRLQAIAESHHKPV